MGWELGGSRCAGGPVRFPPRPQSPRGALLDAAFQPDPAQLEAGSRASGSGRRHRPRAESYEFKRGRREKAAALPLLRSGSAWRGPSRPIPQRELLLSGTPPAAALRLASCLSGLGDPPGRREAEKAICTPTCVQGAWGARNARLPRGVRWEPCPSGESCSGRGSLTSSGKSCIPGDRARAGKEKSREACR